MDLPQLAYFVAVAEERNFTRAARRTHIAQPAISRQVIQLERELGVRLFIRDPTGVRLTEDGRALLPHARAALAAVNSARDALSALRGLLTGRLAIGTILPAPDTLAPLIGEFRREHPGVELQLREGHTHGLLGSVTAGELDIALIGLGISRRPPPAVVTEQVQTEPVVAVASRNHPLANRRSVTLIQLADEPMVTLPQGSGQREMLEAAAAAAGFALRITAESNDVRMLVELATHGVGVGLVPLSAATANRDRSVIPISRPRLQRRLLLTWRADTLSAAARAWLKLARTRLTKT